jgi:fatty acid synthase
LSGSVTAGVTYPSGDCQNLLIREVYNECGVKPSQIDYLEAHGTGTKVGDPQEVNSVADVFCTPDRNGPLLMGSTKSNMGHPEGASGKLYVTPEPLVWCAKSLTHRHSFDIMTSYKLF